MVGSILTNKILPLAQHELSSKNPVDVAAVVVTGLVVVFIALILLILFVWIYGKIFDTIEKNKVQKKNEKPLKAAKSADKVELAKAEPENAGTQGTDDEVVAVIMAAISAMGAEDGKNYRVKSIKPARSSKGANRSVWAFEGLRQQTSPF